MSVADAQRIRSDRDFLLRAARLALRGHGGAEPNPLVGCVLVRDGQVVAEGFHRRCGEAHAEAMALERAGPLARGATAYVTLEPCNHHGRTPPCSQALIRAGVVRVVYAQSDPNPLAAGGALALSAAGIDVELLDCSACAQLNAPFLHRVRTGLPWVIAKWAQSIDGAIATRSGDSKWISCERSRRLVHRERGRVDVIMTGVGTATADDPALTARGVRRRRIALRLLVDPQLSAPHSSRLLDPTLAPTLVACRPELVHGGPANGLRERGVDVTGLGPRGELRPLLAALLRERAVSTVLVEAGGGLVGDLLRENLVNELWTFLAPTTLGDAEARRPIRGDAPEAIADARRWALYDHRRRGDDLVLRYRVAASRG
jgi:diaminohydroxyphosphoribosylaminopyrimidine deaminase/5-amino-6-(5-phosphoribosylamino)uracil reductase